MALELEQYLAFINYGVPLINQYGIKLNQGVDRAIQVQETTHGFPTLIVGNSIQALLYLGDYDTYVASVYDLTLFECVKPYDISPQITNVKSVRFVKSANDLIGYFNLYDPNDNLIYGYGGGPDTRASIVVNPQGGPDIISTPVYIDICAYERIEGSVGLFCSASFVTEITDHFKELNTGFDTYDYCYNPAALDDLLLAMMEGKTFDPEGEGGEPIESDGGVGDYNRPDQSVDIPDLPSISVCDTGFVSLYKVDSTMLRQLANKLWSADFFDNILKNFNSPLENIVSLGIVPLANIYGTLSEVSIGNYATGIQGDKLSTSFFSIDCGSLNINEYYATFADYADTQLQLYLPYCGVINLSPDDCTRGIIRVVYHFDVFTGSCVALVSCNTNGVWHVLYQKEGNIKSDIPLSGTNYSGVYTGALSSIINIGMAAASMNPLAISGAIAGGVNSGLASKPTYERAGNIGGTSGLLGVQYPYIIFNTPNYVIAEDFKSVKGYVSNINCKIGEESGFLSSNIDDNKLKDLDCTIEEKNLIKQKLAEGIYL